MKGHADYAMVAPAHRVQLAGWRTDTEATMGLAFRAGIGGALFRPFRHRPWPNGPGRADLPVLAPDCGALTPESGASSRAGHTG